MITTEPGASLDALPTYLPDHKKSKAFENGPRLVLGTSGLGGVWGGVDQQQSEEAILYALERGALVFDTAPSYANAENVLGAALKQWNGERPFISTKVGRLRAETAHDFKLDYSSDGIRRSLENSLKTLGVDFINLLFLHEPQLVEASEIPRILETLQSFKEEGLIHRIGLGGNLTQSFRPFMGKDKFEVVSGFLRMNACNLDAFSDDLAFFKARNLAYYNASILHFGLLGSRLENYSENYERESGWLKKRDLQIARSLKKLAEREHMGLPVLAQRYAFGIEEADRIVVGAKNREQIERTLDDWEEGPLPKSLFDTITDIISSFYRI
ncbi:aldo/keto reductase [Fulvivirga sp. M361]|uniref:aldo/keto reductase n=1 Tax=Fulvivirga sp. M361 TaxID=2594266 RepID=UPI001179BFA6|nr:aldo/keto reductase [Fulvivirga sp. M361]TRX57629.1 aldo/keto reductase [Fulvivirga sp. M361]